MSYRNDHEAALARIDALETELEQLRKAAPPPKPPRKRHGKLAMIIASLMVGLGGAAYTLVPTHPVAAEHAPAVAEPAPMPDLPACRAAIVHVSGLDAHTTDPRGPAPRAVTELEHVGARCRDALAQNPAYARWLAAEDELAGDISRIEVYYENDPYKLDGYTTAVQLWREYDAAVRARDAILRVDFPQS